MDRFSTSPLTVVMKLVVTGQRHESSKAGPQREVNLLGCLHPDVDFDYLGPIRIEIVFDPQPGALEEDAAD